MMHATMTEKDTPVTQRKKLSLVKMTVLIVIVSAALIGYLKFGDVLSLEYLASKEEGLRELKQDNPVQVMGLSFAFYVAATGLSLPGAAVLTLVCGWFFGFAQGIILVSFASTAGATLAFLFSRFLLRDTIEAKFGEKLKGFNEALKREGAFYLFSLRLIPVVPFFVINLVMGLTPLRVSTFGWVSQIGMLPATAVFVYAGAQFPSLVTLAEKGTAGILTPQLLAAFVVLGVFPILVKKVMARVKTGKKTTAG